MSRTGSKEQSDQKDEQDQTNNGISKTSVLKAGTVESRGHGSSSSREQVAQEIVDFLQGEGKWSLRAETRAFFTVWIFITRLPAPTWVDQHPGYLMRGMCYFPLAGCLVGILVSVFYDMAHAVFGLPTIVAACMSQASSLWVTGCFHEDGLADSADGIGGGWTRQQILRIMTDTRLGTYGSAVLFLYMLTKIQLLACLGTSHYQFQESSGAGPAILAAHTLARLTAPWMIRTRDYVDETGPKYEFYSFMVQAKHLVSWYRVFFAILVSYAIATALYGPETAVGLVVVVLAISHLAGAWGTHLLGGVMGDFLGATICVTELVVLSLLLADVQITAAEAFDWIGQSMNSPVCANMLEQIYQRLTQALEEPNQPLGVALRFFLVIATTTLWCSFVGHPSMLLSDTFVEQQDQKKDDN